MQPLNIIHAARCEQPAFITKRRGTQRQQEGLRYEKKAIRALKALWPQLESGVWFRYETAEQPGVVNYAQVDAIVARPDKLILIEIKLAHTADAFFQLAHRYRPIVSHVFQSAVAEVEVCRWLDPSTAVPWPYQRIFDLRDSTPHRTSVMQLTPVSAVRARVSRLWNDAITPIPAR